MQIRPFTDGDYAAVCEIGNRVFPEYPRTVDELRWGDAHRDPKCEWGRFVAESGGRVVAVADYGQSSGMYHPRKFGVWVTVVPERQGRGIGSALYDHLCGALQPFDPLSLRSNARENMPRSVRFLRDRGFAEDMRYWESQLDVAAFDPAPYAGAEERVRAGGIAIRTMAELAGDPDRDRKLYELTQAIQEDVPSPEPHTRVDYEQWRKRLENPGLLPDANFIALDGDRYVGFSNLWKSQGDDHLHTGLTGVLRAYRRRGIALALKLRAVAYAKARGAPVIRTGNETGNRAMLSINEKLGFARQPAWIDFVKVVKEEKA